LKARTSILILLATFLAIAVITGPTAAIMNPQENVNLDAGSLLIVRSDQSSIRSVIVQGNLTAATISTSQYPSKNFTITTNSTQQYTLSLWLSSSSAYTAFIETRNHSTNSTFQVTSFYVSSGDLNLTIYATFQPGPASGQGSPLGFNSFYDWLAQFGGAFPPWIKILYLVLGVQFAFVGQRWIRFEDERRRLEGHLPPLDRGNKLYLWTDIAFRGLLTGFAISLAIMVGELLIILIAQYLLFVNLPLFSLLDFFSLFFVVAIASLLYLGKEGLDRFLDLKPMMED